MKLLTWTGCWEKGRWIHKINKLNLSERQGVWGLLLLLLLSSCHNRFTLPAAEHNRNSLLHSMWINNNNTRVTYIYVITLMKEHVLSVGDKNKTWTAWEIVSLLLSTGNIIYHYKESGKVVWPRVLCWLSESLTLSNNPVRMICCCSGDRNTIQPSDDERSWLECRRREAQSILCLYYSGDFSYRRGCDKFYSFKSDSQL